MSGFHPSIAEKLWRDHLAANGYPTGGELTVGACAALLVPCQCVAEQEPELDTNGYCDWCCGTRVTERVRKA